MKIKFYSLHFSTIFLLICLFSQKIEAQDEFSLLTSIHGEKDGDNFIDVDAIGDINGDGYADFIVGDSGEYVKLYLGSSPFDTLNCIKFMQGTRKRIYSSGCGGGDLNGDGYNDFVINSSYDYDDYRVYVYYGGKEIDTLPDITITNTGYRYDFGGRSISGDLNNDGFDDLLISAPNDYFDARGRVYIYYGGAVMDAVCDVYLEGKEGFDMFGWSTCMVGDLNNDGFDDFVVGAPQDLKGESGKAYLFFGGDSIGFYNSLELIGNTSLAYNSYGRMVSGLGDINGDGFDDFGIMSLSHIDIFLGGNDISQQNSYVLDSKTGFGFLGKLKDLNKDNFDDFVTVSEDINMFLGQESLDTTPDIQLNSWATPINNIGDINGDGKDEITFSIGGGWSLSGIVNIYNYGKVDFIDNLLTTSPSGFTIRQNYPNPFNPSTIISWQSPFFSHTTIKVFDILGNEVATLVDEEKPAGEHKEEFNASKYQLSSGVYFCELKMKGGNSSRIKMVFIK